MKREYEFGFRQARIEAPLGLLARDGYTTRSKAQEHGREIRVGCKVWGITCIEMRVDIMEMGKKE